MPRTLHSEYVDSWQKNRQSLRQDPARYQQEVSLAVQDGQFGELFSFTGQSAGQIKEILPAAEIVRRMVKQAEESIAHLSVAAK